MMDLDLDDRIALVTGASAGIGRGVAAALAGSGARIVAAGRNSTRLAELVEQLPGGLSRHRMVTADLSTAAGVDATIAAAKDMPTVDIIVNNAGQSVPAPIGADDGTWRDAFAVQFHAPRLLTEALLPRMQSQQFGRIVLIGGTLEPGDVPNASTAAKAALVVWAKALANAVAREGITVNTVAPGRVASEQIETVLHPDPVERAAFIAARIPAARFGEPDEIGQLIAFLASPHASYVTGSLIPFDGGMRRYAF